MEHKRRMLVRESPSVCYRIMTTTEKLDRAVGIVCAKFPHARFLRLSEVSIRDGHTVGSHPTVCIEIVCRKNMRKDVLLVVSSLAALYGADHIGYIEYPVTLNIVDFPS